MRIKYENPKSEQYQKANHLGYSTSTLKRYRKDINKLPPYRIQPNNSNKRTKITSNTNFDNKSHRNPDVKRPHLTSNDLRMTSNESFKKEIAKLKDGDPSSDSQNDPTNLIEQAFSSK